MNYQRNQILSIQTGEKSVVVNKVNNKYELIFKTKSRLMCVAWVSNYQCIDSIIKHFLSTGEVSPDGIWMV